MAQPQLINMLGISLGHRWKYLQPTLWPLLKSSVTKYCSYATPKYCSNPVLQKPQHLLLPKPPPILDTSQTVLLPKVPLKYCVFNTVVRKPSTAAFRVNLLSWKQFDLGQKGVHQDVATESLVDVVVPAHIIIQDCSSVLKKRRRKMNTHKYKKLRKKMKFLRRRLGK